MPELSVTGVPHCGAALSVADVILINIGGRDFCSATTHTEIADAFACFPEARFIVLSERSSPEMIAAAVESGIQAYVTASLSLDMLVAVIRLVLVGGLFFPPKTVAKSAQYCLAEPRNQDPATLGAKVSKRLFTEREKEVLSCLQEGKPNKIIAHELNIASSTVKVHIRNIMKKLNVTNRTQAVLRAAEPELHVSQL